MQSSTSETFPDNRNGEIPFLLFFLVLTIDLLIEISGHADEWDGNAQ